MYRPNRHTERGDLWSIERQAAGIETGELALRPGFGKDSEGLPVVLWPYVLLALSVLGLGSVLFL